MEYSEILDRYNYSKRIDKGMSGDIKYHVKNNDKEYLIRFSDIKLYEQKKREFCWLKRISEAIVNVPKPLEFGILKNNCFVYIVIEYIAGNALDENIDSYSEIEQYNIGYEVGKILRKIHEITSTENSDWMYRYFKVIDERIGYFISEKEYFKDCEKTLTFLNKYKYLLKNRPVNYIHGDFHIGNIIYGNDRKIYVIDWHEVDFNNLADPWYEFNRIEINYPYFASGQIDGYFDKKIPDDFWVIMSYYFACSYLTSIVWAKYFCKEEYESIKKSNEKILYWYNNFECFIPNWYSYCKERIK